MAGCLCLIVSGPVGSGKTTALRELAGILAREGWRGACALQPDLGRNPRRSAQGFALELLETAKGGLEARTLALARERKSGEEAGDGQALHGRYLFELSAFKAAEDFIGKAIAGEPGPDFLALDEMGKLEIAHRAGLRPCLDLALAAAARAAAGGTGPRLIILAARDINVPELKAMAEAAGLAAAVLGLPEGRAGLVTAARAALRTTSAK